MKPIDCLMSSFYIVNHSTVNTVLINNNSAFQEMDNNVSTPSSDVVPT